MTEIADRVGFEAFLQRQADALVDGRVTEFAQIHIHPVAVYRSGQAAIEMTPEETALSLARRHRDLRRRRITSVKVELRDVSLRGTNRARLESFWRYRNANGTVVDDSHLVHFCLLREDGTWGIEMIELVTLAFLPEIDLRTVLRGLH